MVDSYRRIVVIGDATLTSQCVDLATAGDLDVVAVVTDDDAVAEHALAAGLQVVQHPSELAAALADVEFDVLLSIVNFRIVPDTVLSRCRVGINFHDGPLPGYAGRNVTSWAIFNGASEHSITWHLMTASVDAGDVVASERFEIDLSDTAFSLNARCYEAALNTFPTVVAALASGEIESTVQPAGERRWFGATQRPIAFVDPAAGVEANLRAARALSFGAFTPNPVGALRLVHDGACLVITSASPSDDHLPVGALVATPIGLLVGTSDGCVMMDGLEFPDGRSVAPREAVDFLGMAEGNQLPSPPVELVEALRAADPALARHENFWRARLATVSSTTPDLLLRSQRPATTSATTRVLPSLSAATDAEVTDAIDFVIAALAVWCERLTGAVVNSVGIKSSLPGSLSTVTASPFVRTLVGHDTTADELVVAVGNERRELVGRGTFLRDLIGRDPALRSKVDLPQIVVESVADLDRSDDSATHDPHELLAVQVDERSRRLRFVGHIDDDLIERIADHIVTLIHEIQRTPSSPARSLSMVGEAERELLRQLSHHEMSYDSHVTIDELVVRQIEIRPDAAAVSCGTETVSYGELGKRVGQLAAQLRASSVQPGDLVGIALDRGIDLVVAVVAILRCGAAYVPLDPAYPIDRLRFMIQDSGLCTVVAPPNSPLVTAIGARDLVVVAPRFTDDGEHEGSTATPVASHTPNDLAYVIYTSGSTGTPKGVMIEHRNVVNFMAAMDEVIDPVEPGTWLAVTSLSFDISVLELLWTLTRGFHVALHGGHIGAPDVGDHARRRVAMSLFYFAAGNGRADESYRLVLDSARWADAAGFEAVWVPERHFHEFGGAYPNPSVMAAAIAAVTTNIAIRAGSVVAPLHSPARIAEEWAVVDNLSGGRAGISFAAGWQPNDFVLNPSAYATAREQLPHMIEAVQQLWRGESVELPGHDGSLVPTRTLPRPIQTELPIWMTSAGSRSTFERAGTLGHHVLTHLLGQTLDQLAANIEAYRSARRDAGHSGDGHVTLMVHAFLSSEVGEARRLAREPMKRYLSSSAGLLRNMASAFPTFAGSSTDADAAFASLTAEELDELLDVSATRYLEASGMFGSVDDAVEFVEQCADIGVDECACLIDFGIDVDAVLSGLPLLGQVRDRLGIGDQQQVVPTADEPASIAELIESHGVTHFQCTPSQVRMLLADERDRLALAGIRHVLVGGEALPTNLASELRATLTGRLTNMYGPTETTVWSLAHEIVDPHVGAVPIGRPLGNTTVVVLDGLGQQLPFGADGEIHIAGDGVARGYHLRPDLTAERFVDRPEFGRTYATGDIGRVRADGVFEFIGRADHQVKIRGHRIELGEIESVLDRHPDIVQSIVVPRRSTAGDWLLVGLYTTHDGRSLPDASLRQFLGEHVPDAFVPTLFARVVQLPYTPNGKVDRSALIADLDNLLSDTTVTATPAAWDDPTEHLVAECWLTEMGRSIGLDENFFEAGGNSLIAVAVFRRLSDATTPRLRLTDIFRYPTVRTLARHIESLLGKPTEAVADDGASDGADRGARRRRRALTRRAE
jgi:natural product biosynthesis luciferase-like monooxygenase protein